MYANRYLYAIIIFLFISYIAMITVEGNIISSSQQSPATNKQPSTMYSKESIQILVDRLRRLFTEYPESGPPMGQRAELMEQMEQAFKITKPQMDHEIENYIKACYKLSAMMTTYDMGKGDKRFSLCQIVIAECLPYVDAVSVDLAMNIVSQMSHNYDLQNNPLTADNLSDYRNLYAEIRLIIWRRIYVKIDPLWKQDDPNNIVFLHLQPKGNKYLPGTPPDKIVEQEIRKDYERRLAENAAKAEKNTQQFRARQNCDVWLKRALKEDLIDMYEKAPVTNTDMEMLKALLRVYVVDEKIRNELYELATKAAKQQSVSSTMPASQPK